MRTKNLPMKVRVSQVLSPINQLSIKFDNYIFWIDNYRNDYHIKIAEYIY